MQSCPVCFCVLKLCVTLLSFVVVVVVFFVVVHSSRISRNSVSKICGVSNYDNGICNRYCSYTSPGWHILVSWLRPWHNRRNKLRTLGRDPQCVKKIKD